MWCIVCCSVRVAVGVLDCVLVIVYRLLLGVYCLLFAVCCLLCVVSCFLIHVYELLFLASCFWLLAYVVGVR